MEIVTLNLLDILHKSQVLYSTDYSGEFQAPADLLETVLENEGTKEHIVDGIMFLQKTSSRSFLVVDGMKRIIQFSLLLHALCECYKLTNEKNIHAIELIKKRYLFYGQHTKIHLHGYEKIIYEKLVKYERMTNEEKEHPMFKTLHEYWAKIKMNNISATKLFDEIKNLKVIACVYENNDIDNRDIYQYLNCNNPNIEELLLINSFINENVKNDVAKSWYNIIEKFQNSNLANHFKTFLQNYLTIQKNGIIPRDNELYLSFKRYYLKLTNANVSPKNIFENIDKFANYYIKIINANFENTEIKNLITTINENNMHETYPYILEVIEDYSNGNITQETIVQLLNTVINFIEEQRNNNFISTINFAKLSQEINQRIE